METATLARPYARAAFQVASEHGVLDAWSRYLAAAAAIAADPRIVGLGNDPQVSPDELARLHRPDGIGDDALFVRLLDVVAGNRRLALLPEIAAQFDQLRRAAERRVKVRVTCAATPADEQVAALARALNDRLERQADVEIAVDPDILGGAVISIDGEVIDGSVRGRLQRLHGALVH